MTLNKPFACLTVALAAAFATPLATAQTEKPPAGLPSTLAWSAYDVGSGGYNQAVAIGNAPQAALRDQPARAAGQE